MYRKRIEWCDELSDGIFHHSKLPKGLKINVESLKDSKLYCIFTLMELLLQDLVLDPWIDPAHLLFPRYVWKHNINI